MNKFMENLEGEIGRIYERMQELEPHSAEYEKLADRFEEMLKIKIEEFALVVDDRKNERDNNTKRNIELAGLGLSAVTAFIFMHKGFKFEETGSFNSTTFRWWWNKLKLRWK